VEERVKAIMADILMLDVAQIGDNASMKTLEQWDSLAQMDIIAALEEEFAVTFEVEEFQTMTNFAEIIETLTGKL
jgi:acyl carrier protein